MVNCKGSDFVKLSGEILGQGSSLRFRARGGSMHPFIRDGEVIQIKPVKFSEIRIGDVIFYRTSQDRMVAHRVVKKCRRNGEMALMAKGDSISGFDQLIHPEDVLGRVVAIEKGDRARRLDKGLARLTNIFWAKISPFSPWIYPILRKIRGVLRWSLGGVVRKIQGLKFYRDLIKKLIREEICYQVATPDDAFSLARLYRYDQRPECDSSTEALSEQFKSVKGSGYWLVAKKKNRVVGGATLTKLSESNFPYVGWWLFGMVVNWRYRGMGIGEQLTKMAMEKAAEDGASEIKLTVFEDAKPAISLYRKLGFHRISIPELDEQLEEEAKRSSRRWIILVKCLRGENANPTR